MKPFLISRELDAPRERVWQAWTEPERLRQWFSPKGFGVIAAKLDLRPGGTYHYGMRMPDGKEMWGKWLIREVKRPERLVFVNTFSDPQGGLTRHPFAPDWPAKMLSTITFTEQGKGTLLTIEWAPMEASEAELKTFDAGRPSMTQGWSGTFENLTHYLKG
ncbi:MAG TPA: SRPBCC domain-containing protein [Burkholderiales bacterium]|nr:SRPBCC domain-containing protein [Burkholderiales bacterium]